MHVEGSVIGGVVFAVGVVLCVVEGHAFDLCLQLLLVGVLALLSFENVGGVQHGGTHCWFSSSSSSISGGERWFCSLCGHNSVRVVVASVRLPIAMAG